MIYTYKFKNFKDLNNILGITISRTEKMSKFANVELYIKKLNNEWNLEIEIHSNNKIKFK